jgi:gamma-glutamyl hydrolase
MVKLIIIDPKNQDKYKNRFLNHYNNGDLTAHMVYMPGCGHCDDMKPSWKSVCQNYNNHDYKMISIIHMQSYSDFMGSKDSPMGFPHVVAHRDQKIIPYSGDRSEQDINKWLDKHSKTKKIVFRGGKKSRKYRIFNKITKKNKRGKKTRRYKKRHRITVKQNKKLQNCGDLSTSKYNSLLESKHIANKIINKTDKQMFLHRGNIHNIGDWTSEMKRRYKNLKHRYSMKPNTKEWDEFKKLTKCNITRHISLNNNVRVIGIMSTPTYTDASLGATSFIPQSYVKWAELHGARIIPIQYDLPLPVINSLLEQINGLVLIGGIIEKNVPRKHYYRYLSTLSYIFKKIIHYNLIGNHFPIFSICLGFELLPMITISKNLSELSDYYENYNKISQHRNINQSSIQFTRLNSKDDKEMLCKSPQKYFSKSEINKIEKTPITYFTHGKAFLTNEKYMKEYNNFLTVTATAKVNGKKVVAMYQYKSFPFYGTQFHPEKSLYEWREEDVSHSDDAIMFSNRLCKIFMDECNKNYNISAFVGNNNNNMLIENYDLLSRENTNKILYPHNSKNVNSDILGATYYFGRLDNIQSNLTTIDNISMEELKHKDDKHHKHYDPLVS